MSRDDCAVLCFDSTRAAPFSSAACFCSVSTSGTLQTLVLVVLWARAPAISPSTSSDGLSPPMPPVLPPGRRSPSGSSAMSAPSNGGPLMHTSKGNLKPLQVRSCAHIDAFISAPAPPAEYGSHKFPAGAGFPVPRSFTAETKNYASGKKKGSDFDVSSLS